MCIRDSCITICCSRGSRHKGTWVGLLCQRALDGDGMNDTTGSPPGPDLTTGVSLSRIPHGSILRGHAHGEPVMLARRGGEVFAIGAFCSHYGAPLADGLLVGD